ncbi:MAG: hypothetical protein K2Q17_02010 [Nitrospiraceae bacterium]|jgi:hypothetical protein|uniref:DUF6988 family protein n=1 Tax=Nitrospira cf. moscoviensis SBR1015 TaxID=96242 RepID=UPI001121BF34|nr:hypothetical protein [Nitrospira cf. moscoviensis SBR1015]MBY0246414.1 hypothetical protein [Nitrospiraceae bacterium]
MATLQQAKELALGITSAMNGRGAPNGLRGNIAAGSFDAVREHHSSINLLMENCLYGSAFALLRPMFDGCIVGLWATYLATDELLERFEAGRYTLSPQKIITQLKSRDDGSYTDTLQRMYGQAWKPLSSYVHGGHLSVSRRNAATYVGPSYAVEEVSEVITFSNAMVIIAAIEIPDLTTDPEFKDTMMQVINTYIQKQG